MTQATAGYESARIADGRDAARVALPRGPDWLVLVGLVALYVTGAVLLVALYPPIANPDGTSYLSVAQHWVDGDLRQAVASHWAPLYTWLVAPLLALGMEPVAAGSAVQLAAGVTVLVATWLLLDRLSTRTWIRTLTCLALVPVLVRWTYYPVGPDLVVAGIYLWLLVLLTAPGWSVHSRRLHIGAGVLLGLAYLAKGTSALVLSLIAVVVALYIPWRGERGRPRAYLRALGLVLLVAGVLVIPWAIAISVDEDHPTLGTSPAYSAAVVAPARQGAHPTTTDGFLAPPHANAFSAWEDPERLKIEPWSPIDDPRYAVKRFAKNLARFAARGVEAIPLAAILALVALFAARGGRRPLVWLLAGFAVAIVLLYSPLLTQERYAWASYVLLLVLAGWVVGALLQRRSIGPGVAMLLLGTVALSNLALAVRELDMDGLHTGKEERRVADALRELPVTNVATNSEWHEAMAVAFHAGDRYFGVFRKGQSADSVARDLDQLKVDGFVYWGPPDRHPAYLDNFTRGATDSLDGMPVSLYSRR